MRNRDFFGGSLAGVEEKLDYLKSLGVGTMHRPFLPSQTASPSSFWSRKAYQINSGCSGVS